MYIEAHKIVRECIYIYMSMFATEHTHLSQCLLNEHIDATNNTAAMLLCRKEIGRVGKYKKNVSLDLDIYIYECNI